MILFRFDNPIALFGLFAVLAFGLLMWWQKRRYPGTFSWVRFVLLNLSIVMLVLGLARPQLGQNTTETRMARSHVYIAIDISRSMLAQDIPPSRMTFAISFAQSLVQLLPGVKIALYPFASSGFLLMPLTNDTDAAADMLTSLSPSFTANQGTNFGRALEKLFQNIVSLDRKAVANGDQVFPTQVVVLSDGETHEPIDPVVLQTYRKQRIPIFTVAVGTPEGATIPVERRMTAEEMLKDRGGKVIRTQLQASTLKMISEQTQGEIFNARFDEVSRLARRLTQNAQMGKLSTSFRVDREFFPMFLTVAFFLLMLEFLRGRWQFALRAFILFAFWIPTARADDEPAVDDATRAVQLYNQGVKEMSANNLQKASQFFQESAGLSDDLELKKKALYNLGNALLKQTDPVQALEAYQQAADIESGSKSFDKSANQKVSDNMALAAKLLEQMKQQPNQGNEGQKGDDKGGKGQQPEDEKGPKKFKAQDFNESQKKKIFDLVASEEQQTMQRIQDQKNKGNANQMNEKPW